MGPWTRAPPALPPAPGQSVAYHQILQGQRLVHVPQDLDLTLVGQFEGREATRFLLLLLNDLQALAGPSSPNSAGSGGPRPPRAQVFTFLLGGPSPAVPLLCQPFLFLHTSASTIPAPNTPCPLRPTASQATRSPSKRKPCLLQQAFLNFTFSHKSVLPLTVPQPLSWEEHSVVERGQARQSAGS